MLAIKYQKLSEKSGCGLMCHQILLCLHLRFYTIEIQTNDSKANLLKKKRSARTTQPNRHCISQVKKKKEEKQSYSFIHISVDWF